MTLPAPKRAKLDDAPRLLPPPPLAPDMKLHPLLVASGNTASGLVSVSLKKVTAVQTVREYGYVLEVMQAAADTLPPLVAPVLDEQPGEELAAWVKRLETEVAAASTSDSTPPLAASAWAAPLAQLEAESGREWLQFRAQFGEVDTTALAQRLGAVVYPAASSTNTTAQTSLVPDSTGAAPGFYPPDPTPASPPVDSQATETQLSQPADDAHVTLPQTMPAGAHRHSATSPLPHPPA